MKRVRKLMGLLLMTVCVSCAKPSPVYVKQEPCRVAPYPDKLEDGVAFVCEVNGKKFLCLDGPTAVSIGKYIEQTDRYHDSLAACPAVEEVRDYKIGNFLAPTPAPARQ